MTLVNGDESIEGESVRVSHRGIWKRNPVLVVVLLVIFLGTVYWALLASDRYVSQTHVIVQKTDLNIAQGLDFGSLLGGIAGGNTHEDQMLLRDYLLSIDMLRKLEEQLGLRQHFSSAAHDPISRMWFEDEPIEGFHRYFRRRVSVDFDDYSGVLIVTAQAFEPEMARSITQLMLDEGERFMNELSHRLASEQVSFLEEQVERLQERVQDTRNRLIQFQNVRELISPKAAVESRIALIAKLEGARADLQTRLATMKAYLVSSNPAVEQINQRLAAIEKQIEQESQGLASVERSETLNRALEEYQQMELEAGFAEEAYKSALIALEKGRVDASRKLKKVSVLQQPTLPEYPEQPRRIYNSLVFILFSFIIAGLIHLMIAVIRDHKD